MIIQSHPALYLGLSFEPEAKNWALLNSQRSVTLLSLLRHRGWDAHITIRANPTRPVCWDWEDSWGMKLSIWKPGKSQTMRQFGHLDFQRAWFTRGMQEKNASLDISELLQPCKLAINLVGISFHPSKLELDIIFLLFQSFSDSTLLPLPSLPVTLHSFNRSA